MMKILAANMINEYTAIFNDARDKLGTTGAREFVETWVQVGRRVGDNAKYEPPAPGSRTAG
jgi:hypothetical protein